MAWHFRWLARFVQNVIGFRWGVHFPNLGQMLKHKLQRTPRPSGQLNKNIPLMSSSVASASRLSKIRLEVSGFLTLCESRKNDDSPFHQAALVSASSASRQTKRDGQGHLGLFEQARSRLVRQERHPLGILGSRAHAGGCPHLAKI